MSSIKWNRNIPWVKKSDYILRVLEESFAPNNKGNPMVTLKCEVAAPDTVVNNNGDEMTVAGVPITHWCTIASLNGNENDTPEVVTAKCRERYINLLNAFELPTIDINWDNPQMGFKNKTVYAFLDDQEVDERGSPSKADLAKGIKQGPILINPKTKKPLVSHYPEIKEIYCLAELTTTAPY